MSQYDPAGSTVRRHCRDNAGCLQVIAARSSRAMGWPVLPVLPLRDPVVFAFAGAPEFLVDFFLSFSFPLTFTFTP